MKTGPIGEALEVLQEEVEQGVSTAKQQITGKPQQTGSQQSGQKPQQSAASDQTGATAEATSTNQPQDDSTKTFVQDLYGGKAPSINEAEIKQKELEDKQKTEELRQRLHSEYYQRLTTPPKQREPRVQDKLEMEKQEEEEKKSEEEAKKPKDLPLVVTKNMGTKEKLRGVSG